MATRSIAAVAVVGAAVVGVAVCIAALFGQGTASTGVSAAASRPARVPSEGSLPANVQQDPFNPTPRPSPQAASFNQRRAGAPTTNERSESGGFSLVVAMRSGTITTNVTPLSAMSNQPVDPPHKTARQWNTAAWIKQSTYPSTPAKGTTYVYGHACHYHVCPFTNLKDAGVGDKVWVTTAARTTRYTIERIGLSSKSASSLPSWASNSAVPNRIVLVTCNYEQGDNSANNIVVVARLDR